MVGAAIPVTSSQSWENGGNNGPWSTFPIQVGAGNEVVQVLPATGILGTWLVLPLGCNGTFDDANCVNGRGRLFDPNSSSTYQPLGGGAIYSLPFLDEAPLQSNTTSFAGGALEGLDSLRLGYEADQGALSGKQFIASYATYDPFVGQLGLLAQNVTVQNSTDTHFTLLGFLNETNTIPSAMWAYTAGSQNRSTFGSLTFGGYDAERGNTDNVLTTSLSIPYTADLALDLTGIQIGSSNLSGVTSMPYLIDSLFPEIWLPMEICSQFEEAFSLTWNSEYAYYYVNDTQRAKNQASGPSVTFSLAAKDDPTSTTKITMPYASFDLEATWPYLGNPSQTSSIPYFPLKRATNSSQYFFGRAFLQDAYLAVNYDTGKFNLSQAQFPEINSNVNIITVVSHGAPSNQSHSGLSGGAIAGIVIGVLAVLVLVLGALFWYRRRKRQQQQQQDKALRLAAETLRSPSSDATTIAANVDATQMVEEHFAKPVDEPFEADGIPVAKEPELELHGQSHEVHELYGDYQGRVSELSGEDPPGGRSRAVNRSESFDISPPLSDQFTPPIGGDPDDPATPSFFSRPFELHNSSHHTRQLSSRDFSIAEETTTMAEAVSSSQTTVSPLQEHADFVDDAHPRGTRNTFEAPNDLAARILVVNDGGTWGSERQYYVVNSEESPERTAHE